MNYTVNIDDTEATKMVGDILIQMVNGNDIPADRESEFTDAVKEVLHYIMIPSEWEAMYKEEFTNLDVAMWSHYCQTERTVMGVGKGEECNWCGATEE